MNMESQSRRKFYRTDFHVKGAYKTADKNHELILVNISLKGAMVCFDNDPVLTPELSGVLEIYLPNSQIVLKIENASLIRKTEDNEYAFKFNEIDPESMIHLRRLLELNSVYEGEIEKELNYLKPD
jgi:c-di-GMP-binding flagellar brake protein YcgR